MKTIGMLGGMSWESTKEYYEILNRLAFERLGENHSCPCLIHSFDFEKIDNLQHLGKWKELTQLLSQSAIALESAGAEIMLICTNTMHKLAGDIEAKLNIPLLHIADAVGSAIKSSGIEKVGLLGTRFTMEGAFYRDRLLEKNHIQTLIPNTMQREVIHGVIYGELVKGIVTRDSRKKFVEIINDLVHKGAGGIILGCTEIPLLIRQQDTSIPLFNSTLLHANAAFQLAMK